MIHYHGCKIAADDGAQLAYIGKHAMVSYANQQCAEMIIECCQSFCQDNGAYTAWTQGKEFDIEGYALWVKEFYRHPAHDFYVIPDVIDGDHHDNAKMRATWFKTVSSDIWRKGWPVYHLHEPLEVLRDLVRAFPHGICLGSSGDYSTIGTAKWWARMGEMMEVVIDAEGRPTIPLHGLRMLDPDCFSRLPLRSADSTNVCRNAGNDPRWKGAYVPTSIKQRALVMMDRIEHHASASRWNPDGIQRNYELFG